MQLFTYTPAGAGTTTLSFTNSATLTNPSNISLTVSALAVTTTSYAVVGPTVGYALESLVYAVVPGGTTWSAVFTPSDGGAGARSRPRPSTWAGEGGAKTFTYSNAAAASYTIAFSNTSAVGNPSSIALTLTSMAALTLTQFQTELNTRGVTTAFTGRVASTLQSNGAGGSQFTTLALANGGVHDTAPTGWIHQAAFATGVLVPANTEQLLGSAVVLDGNGYLSVNIVDLQGAAATGTTVPATIPTQPSWYTAPTVATDGSGRVLLQPIPGRRHDSHRGCDWRGRDHSASFSLGTVSAAATGLLERLARLILRFFPQGSGKVQMPSSVSGSGSDKLTIIGSDGVTAVFDPDGDRYGTPAELERALLTMNLFKLLTLWTPFGQAPAAPGNPLAVGPLAASVRGGGLVVLTVAAPTGGVPPSTVQFQRVSRRQRHRRHLRQPGHGRCGPLLPRYRAKQRDPLLVSRGGDGCRRHPGDRRRGIGPGVDGPVPASSGNCLGSPIGGMSGGSVIGIDVY